ncbi:MAG: hypothetical protein Q8M11_14880 [Sulfuritalea sp.]|nr:hypothetical protein [Sulfuritalea sp.]
MNESIFQEKLAEVRAVFPGRLAVAASIGAVACGIAAKTLRNRLTAGDAPFATFKIGDRRLVELAELARFMAAQSSAAAVAAPASSANLGDVAGHPARGRPSHGEEAAAAAAGYGTVKSYRAAQRAKAAAEDTQ